MPTTFVDNFYVMDPYAPPPPGTPLVRNDFTVTDQNNNGTIGTFDTIDGATVYASYPGDTVTVQAADGSIQTITGVTFYLSDGRQVFSPIDGSTLQDATFVSSSWVPTNTPVTPAQMQLTCFTPGALIATPGGTRSVERMRVGDLVETVDHGAQKIRWIGRRVVPGQGDFAPIRFMAGAIGNTQDLRVSPQHRMLIQGWRAELLFGEPEVLVAAKHLVNGDTIHAAPCEEVEYIHICFDRHELIWSGGVTTESFHPGDYVLAQDRALMGELTTLFPELRGTPGSAWDTARPVLRGCEAAMFA